MNFLPVTRKEIYEQFVLEDLSLSEIAGEAGISRQGVHDLIKRCQKALEGYEEKLHLVEKFLSIKEKVHEIDSVLDAYESSAGNQKPQEIIEKIRKISDTIIEEFIAWHFDSFKQKKLQKRILKNLRSKRSSDGR